MHFCGIPRNRPGGSESADLSGSAQPEAGDLGGFYCPCNHFRKVPADKWVPFGEHKAAPDLQLKHAYSKCRHIYAELHKHVRAHPEDAHLFNEISSGSECIAA